MPMNVTWLCRHWLYKNAWPGQRTDWWESHHRSLAKV
jgi:hypothetical protein